MVKLKAGEAVSKRVRINSHDLLIFTNRGSSGKDYEALQEALERIRGTTISTNIRTGDEEQVDTFGLIDSSSIRRKHGLDLPQPRHDEDHAPRVRAMVRPARARRIRRRPRRGAGLGRLPPRTGMARLARRERHGAPRPFPALCALLRKLVREARTAVELRFGGS